MLTRVVLTLIPLLVALGGPALAQQRGPSSVGPEGGVVGDPNGSIRAMGAAGYNAHRARSSSAVDIPPIDMGRAEIRGLPLGTTGPRHWH